MRCDEFLSRIILLTMQPLKKPPDNAAIMTGIRPNVEDVAPICMIRAELTKLAETSRLYPRKRFDKDSMVTSPFDFTGKGGCAELALP